MDNSIFAIMKASPQWHLWRNENGSKVPYQINGRDKAKSNDPSTWSSWDDANTAFNALAEYGFEMAFTLGPGGQFVGVDFDDAVTDDGLRDWAKPLWDMISKNCYAEDSPSGTGFKCIMLGTKPEGARCSISKGDGKQAIEIYDHNRFWAFTRSVIEFGTDTSDSTGLVKSLCHEAGLLAEKVSQPSFSDGWTVTSAPSESKFSSDETVEFRARQWLSKVTPPAPGSRNNVLFRTSGSLLAFDGLAEQKAWELLSEFNGNSADPVSNFELSAIFRSSKQNGTARQSKGANASFKRDVPKVDANALGGMPVLLDESFIEDVSTTSEALYKPDSAEEQIPREYMADGGFIESIMDWVEAMQDEVHPEFGFAAALHLTGLALSRNYIDDSVRETTGNLYSMILADSGAGKDCPRRAIGKFLGEVGRLDFEGPSVIDSGAGLANAMVKSPSMSMLLDEAGEMFSNLSSPKCPQHFRKVGTVLKGVYTSSSKLGVRMRSLANSDNGQNDPVDFPHLHIMATATKKQVLSSISDNQIEDGLMGRFLMFFGTDDPVVKRATKVPTPESAKSWFCRMTRCGGDNMSVGSELINEINKPELSEVRRSEEAVERLESHYEAISETRRRNAREGKSLPEQSIWNRASEKTAKLALLFAASRSMTPGGMRIEIEDANRAIKVSNAITRRVVKSYQNRVKSEYQEIRKSVLLTITSGFTTEAQVYRLNSSIEPGIRARAIKDLIESREITRVQKGEKVMYSRGTLER